MNGFRVGPFAGSVQWTGFVEYVVTIETRLYNLEYSLVLTRRVSWQGHFLAQCNHASALSIYSHAQSHTIKCHHNSKAYLFFI